MRPSTKRFKKRNEQEKTKAPGPLPPGGSSRDNHNQSSTQPRTGPPPRPSARAAFRTPTLSLLLLALLSLTLASPRLGWTRTGDPPRGPWTRKPRVAGHTEGRGTSGTPNAAPGRQPPRDVYLTPPNQRARPPRPEPTPPPRDFTKRGPIGAPSSIGEGESPPLPRPPVGTATPVPPDPPNPSILCRRNNKAPPLNTTHVQEQAPEEPPPLHRPQTLPSAEQRRFIWK